MQSAGECFLRTEWLLSEQEMMSPPVCARCIYLSLGCVCLSLAGVTFGRAVSVVVFLVELNNPFCPQLNGRNGLGMCLQAFLVFLGSGPNCVTGPVTRTDCDVYHRVHSHMMSSLLHAFVVSNSQQNACVPDGIQRRLFQIRVQYPLMALVVTYAHALCFFLSLHSVQ